MEQDSFDYKFDCSLNNQNIEKNILKIHHFPKFGAISRLLSNIDNIYQKLIAKGNTLIAKGNMQFEDVTEKAAVGGKGNWSTGVTMADVNADGYLDIYVCNVGNYKGFTGRNKSK